MKRLFDIIVSFFGIIILTPLFFIIGCLVAFSSAGSAFFFQERVGRNGKRFLLAKFRTMYKKSEKKGQLTTSHQDARITRIGGLLRKFKLDELPQLFNVLVGDMSLVGPRPEVPKYVYLYNEEQKKVLQVKPGITGYAALQYTDENKLLASANNAEKKYIEEIMPAKLELELKYIEERSFWVDLKVLVKTFFKVFF